MNEREMNLRLAREMTRLAIKQLPVEDTDIGLKLMGAMSDMDRSIKFETELRTAVVVGVTQ